MLSSPVTKYDTTLGETLAYIGNNNGYVLAIKAANGALVWSDNFGVPIYATPTAFGDSVWVGTFINGHMYKLNATTGAVECDLSLGTGTDLASPTIATPPGGKPTVYFGVQDNGVVSGPIMAVDEGNCQVKWAVDPYSVGGSGSWNPTSFGVDANGEALVFAGSGDPDSTAYALDANTGATVWSDQNHSPSYGDVGSGIVVSPPGDNGFADGMVYYSGKDRLVYAIDMTTGALQWTFDVAAATGSSGSGGRSAPALVGNELVFGTPVGVMAINAITGTEIWNSAQTVGSDTEVLSSPLVTGPPGHQIVVYGDLLGRVIVLSLADGSELYSFKTHGYVVGSPADSNGHLLITSSDGFLYDFSLGRTNNSSYPTTSITSPPNNSTVPFPGAATAQQGSVTVTGTASSANSCNGVIVAVEQNGASGPWWNATSGDWQQSPAWNHANLSSSGCAAGWTFPIPVGRQGAALQVFADTTDSDSEVDPLGATSTFSVLAATKGANIRVVPTMAAPGQTVSVYGWGFGTSEQVQIGLPGVTLAAVTTSATGQLPSVRVTIPTTFPLGWSGISATGQRSGRAATSGLYVAMTWTQSGANPENTAYQPNDFGLAQEETPGEAYRYVPSVVYDTGGSVQSSPAVANLTAYVGNDAGDVEAISTTLGKALWTHKTGGPVDSSPAIDLNAGLVIVGSGDHNVYAFTMATGAQVWHTKTGGAVKSSPAIVNGVVYVGSDDGHLYALKESTGAVEWKAAMAGAVTASPAVDAATGLVIVSDEAGHVDAFAGGGSPKRWRWAFHSDGAVGTPILSGGTVYVGSADGNEYALSEGSGAVRWVARLGGTPSSAALSHGGLYVGSSTGELFALDAATGTVNWQAHTQGPITGVSVTEGVLFIECSNGALAAYRTGGADEVWRANTGAGLSGTPAIVDNAIIVGAGDTGLYVYTPFGKPMI